MNIEDRFIEKSKLFRTHFALSEDDIDYLLSNKKLKYKGLELKTRTLTLLLAEAYPSIFGMDYSTFIKNETNFPQLESLPEITQNYINKKSNTRNRIAVKGTKNKASYILIALKDFPIGRRLTNSEILKALPFPLNKEISIDWGKGLLKGLVRNTKESTYYLDNQGEKRRETVYEVCSVVDSELQEKAMKNINGK